MLARENVHVEAGGRVATRGFWPSKLAASVAEVGKKCAIWRGPASRMQLRYYKGVRKYKTKHCSLRIDDAC